MGCPGSEPKIWKRGAGSAADERRFLTELFEFLQMIQIRYKFDQNLIHAWIILSLGETKRGFFSSNSIEEQWYVSGIYRRAGKKKTNIRAVFAEAEAPDVSAGKAAETVKTPMPGSGRGSCDIGTASYRSERSQTSLCFAGKLR